jgi:hypothetical protein
MLSRITGAFTNYPDPWLSLQICQNMLSNQRGSTWNLNTDFFLKFLWIFDKIWRIQTFIADLDPQFRKTDPDTKGRLITDPPDPGVQNIVFKICLETLICPLLFEVEASWLQSLENIGFQCNHSPHQRKLQSQHCRTSKIKIGSMLYRFTLNTSGSVYDLSDYSRPDPKITLRQNMCFTVLYL